MRPRKAPKTSPSCVKLSGGEGGSGPMGSQPRNLAHTGELLTSKIDRRTAFFGAACCVFSPLLFLSFPSLPTPTPPDNEVACFEPVTRGPDTLSFVHIVEKSCRRRSLSCKPPLRGVPVRACPSVSNPPQPKAIFQSILDDIPHSACLEAVLASQRSYC